MIDVAIAKLSTQRSAMSLASHIEIVLMARTVYPLPTGSVLKRSWLNKANQRGQIL